METIEIASNIANSQVVWSILCILMVGYVLYHSNKRENRLLDNLSSLTEAQHQQAIAMKSISENLATLEGRMDRMERHTFKKGE